MSVAFKEWAVVCDALGDGRQSILLRKGGIAEGRDGFAFHYRDFFLFPTWFHEQIAKTTLPEGSSIPGEPGEEIEIRFAAVLEWTRLVSNFESLAALREFHILHDSVISERFHHDDRQGLHIAMVRVFRLEPPRRIPNDKKFGGCRSWIELPDLDDCTLVSVISDEEHGRRRARILEILGAA
ncbi:MAG: DUF1802 family protein [Verrucomicrobiaceae bacterium]|nr:MAG: DUF1802 family protein [Verrucomicrobiaceae bacterium]